MISFSDSLSVARGVPQGTVLGPLLFNLYINDMLEKVDNKTELIQYADDSYFHIWRFNWKKQKPALIMCYEINQLFQKKHQLSLNASKTEFIVFSKIAIKNQKELLKINGALVEEKQEIKYLAVHIDNRLTFQSEVKILFKKALGIKTIYTISNSSPRSSLKLILNALVLSHLHYSAVVIQSIEKNLCVYRKTNQLGLENFFLLVENWVNQRTEIRT